MNRYHIIQKIIDAIEAQTYLEIGIRRGSIIKNIRATDKIGVDPAINFTRRMQIKKKLGMLDFKVHEVESDIFFEKSADNIYGKKGLDVVFVDGLHEYKQALRDVENSLKYLNKNGAIVMHDCNPLNSAGAYPVKESFEELRDLIANGMIPGWNDCWHGDVWKALVHLRIEHDDLNIFTIDLDSGLGVITYGKGERLQNISISELENSDYSLLEENRAEFLNLKPPSYLSEFFS
jgi:hypothetical protein